MYGMTDTNFNQSLGKIINTIRESGGVTVAAYAEKVGLTAPIQARVESGNRDLSITEFASHAKALGMSASELLALTESVLSRADEMKTSAYGDLNAPQDVVRGYISAAVMVCASAQIRAFAEQSASANGGSVPQIEKPRRGGRPRKNAESVNGAAGAADDASTAAEA